MVWTMRPETDHVAFLGRAFTPQQRPGKPYSGEDGQKNAQDTPGHRRQRLSITISDAEHRQCGIPEQLTGVPHVGRPVTRPGQPNARPT